jgi:hypothetical protein
MRQPPPRQRDLRSLGWPAALGIACLTGIFLAAIVAWSPWSGSEDDAGPGQGGSDVTPKPGQVAPNPPPLPGTPNALY